MITSFYTCKRPVPYIGQALESYFDLYDEKPFVFEQGSVDPYLNRTRVHRVMSDADSLIRNWLFMVKHLVEHTFDTCYMLCEDDIQFKKHVDIVDLSNVGFLSPYCSQANKASDIRGWQTPSTGNFGFCGALCLILSRFSLEQIVKEEERFSVLTKGLHLDYAVGEFFKDKINYVYYPTAVLHIGEISTRASNNDVSDPRHEKIHVTRLPAL